MLVTSTRLPAAVELVHKLGRAGHEVYAADTFARRRGATRSSCTGAVPDQVVAYGHVIGYRIRRGEMSPSNIMQGYS